jgi:hypothetical protein
MGKISDAHWPEDELEALLSELERPVRPDPAFRQALLKELQARLRAQHHESAGLPLPEGLCPFTEFCYAELPLPVALRAACPCLKAQSVLQYLVDRGARIRPRPCLGLALQAKRVAR